MAGYWEFPGGKVEAHEHLLEALRRECLEELNYPVESPLKILDIKHDYPDTQVHLYVFHEFNHNPVVKPAEGQSMKWVTKAALKGIKLPAANQKIVEFLASTPN